MVVDDEAKSAGIIGPVILIAEDKIERVVYGSLKIHTLRADENTAEIKVERVVVRNVDGQLKEIPEVKNFNVAKPRLWFHKKPRMNNGNMTGRYAIKAIEKLDGSSIMLNSVTTKVNCVKFNNACDLLG